MNCCPECFLQFLKNRVHDMIQAEKSLLTWITHFFYFINLGSSSDPFIFLKSILFVYSKWNALAYSPS